MVSVADAVDMFANNVAGLAAYDYYSDIALLNDSEIEEIGGAAVLGGASSSTSYSSTHTYTHTIDGNCHVYFAVLSNDEDEKWISAYAGGAIDLYVGNDIITTFHIQVG